MLTISLVNQTERLYKIEQMLCESGVVQIETLLDRLEISRATFKRDLDYLRDRLHAPIVRDCGPGRLPVRRHRRRRHACRAETRIAGPVVQARCEGRLAAMKMAPATSTCLLSMVGRSQRKGQPR